MCDSNANYDYIHNTSSKVRSNFITSQTKFSTCFNFATKSEGNNSTSVKVLEEIRCVLLHLFSATETHIPVKNAVSMLWIYLNTVPRFLHQRRRFSSGMSRSTAFGTMRFSTSSSVLTQDCATGKCAAPLTLCPSRDHSNSMLTASVILFLKHVCPLYFDSI